MLPFVYQGDTVSPLLDGVLHGPADEALGTGLGYWLDADAGIRTDFLPKLSIRADQFLGFR